MPSILDIIAFEFLYILETDPGELLELVIAVLILYAIVGFIISVICKKYFKKYSFCGYPLGDWPVNWILASFIVALCQLPGLIKGFFPLYKYVGWVFGVIVILYICIFAILLKKLRNKQ